MNGMALAIGVRLGRCVGIEPLRHQDTKADARFGEVWLFR